MQVLPDAAKGEVSVSTPEVHRKLSVRLIDPPVVKTVQRRLERLLDEGLVEAEKRGTAWHWRKCAGAGGLAARTNGMMTYDEALALQTLRRFSSQQIPALVADTLTSIFDVAEQRIEAAHDERERRYRKWADKVEVESGSFALKYPAVDAEIFAEISQALFYEQQLDIVYRSRLKSDDGTPRTVHPLGLVHIGGLAYLVASVPRYPNPATYRLDRVSAARMLPESFAYPRDFKLAEYVRQQRQFDFVVEGEIGLALRFRNGAGDHLIETPLSDDQQIVHGDKALEVRGTVLLSRRLRWWLRSFGPDVEVLAPAGLREELAHEARELAAMYGQVAG